MKKNFVFATFTLFCIILLNGCAEKQTEIVGTLPLKQPLVYGDEDSVWWEHAVFYEIFVRSFYDSDGDGIGDFSGIVEKLDYLNDGNPQTSTDLGVTALWLMPIYPSPSYHGYDVIDYLAVNPQYGTLDDFRNLLEEAHNRGMRVIIDFVVNHTSVDHPWFISAQEPSNPKHDWYIWSDTNPGYKGPWGQEVWYPSDNGKFYYAVFWQGMPDLDMLNPAVTEEITKAADFWINEIGVDGFRVDGAKHLVEEGQNQVNTSTTITWFKNFMKSYKNWNKEFMAVGEVWDSSKIASKYVESSSFDMVFNFDLSQAIINNIRSGSGGKLSGSVLTETFLFKGHSMGTFLTNHDMDRVLSQLGGDLILARHAATILLTIPGTPFLYYGEEIGMQGVKPDEMIRRPMQWMAGVQGGFTSGEPWESLDKSHQDLNVNDETIDETSLLTWYRNLIRVRLSQPALLDGEYYKIEVNDPTVYAGMRIQSDDIILTIINLKNESVRNPVLRIKTDLPPGKYTIHNLVGLYPGNTKIKLLQKDGYIEFKFSKPLQPHQDLVLQLTPTN